MAEAKTVNDLIQAVAIANPPQPIVMTGKSTAIAALELDLSDEEILGYYR